MPVCPHIFDDYRRDPNVTAKIIRVEPPENKEDSDATPSATNVSFDEPQDHVDNEVVRVSHHGAADGVEHVNTTAEQKLLDAEGQHKAIYGHMSYSNTGRLSEVALKKVLDIRAAQQTRESVKPPPMRIRKRTVKPINEFEREVA